ncbi:hypothetical protein B5S32_g2943 [[Candida] boidinii]|nr:hypothetical protein B5S32_g2943 [[Candida] boidinii]
MSETLIIPGETIPVSETSEIVLGPNVVVSPVDNQSIIPTTNGFLNIKEKKGSTLYYVESNTKRYIPQVNDFVIGTIVGAFGEFYRVSLANFSAPAILSQYAFPNATKKNRPHLNIGDIVYARVSCADRELDVEIECIDPTTGKDGGFGVLEGGYLFDVKLGYARYLLFNESSELFNKLVTKVKFEIAIGVNGKVWIKTDDIKSTIACSRSIKEAQNWVKEDISKNVDVIFKTV